MLVNNEAVDDSLIREEARAIRPKLLEAMRGTPPSEVEARVQSWARENVIERVVLRQAALAQTPPPAPDEIEAELGKLASTPLDRSNGVLREEVEIRLRVARLLAGVTAHLSTPRNKDVTEYYRKHKEDLIAPERVHAAHIVKNIDEQNPEPQARQAIDEIYQALQEGQRFEDLADRLSDCPGHGGDLGIFPRGEMVEAFDQIVFSLQPGQISPVFRTDFGYHIVKLIARYEEGIPPLEEVRSRIETHLFEEKKQRAIEQYLDRLIAKADVRNT